MSSAKIVDLIFTKRESSLSRNMIALSLAVGSHAALFLWATSLPIKIPVAVEKTEYVVDIQEPIAPKPEPLPAPEPTPQQEPEPTPEPQPKLASVPKQSTPPPQPQTPPAPAQAGAIIAQEPNPEAPLDFSDNTFITGTSKNFPGGTTATNGTNTNAVHQNNTKSDGQNNSGSGITENKKPKENKKQTVQLDENRWNCAWPKEADAERIDEQSVVIKVVVDISGKVTNATLVSDPGHGFGAAAIACAKKTRFTPALNEFGEKIASTSPPIRVRFTR